MFLNEYSVIIAYWKLFYMKLLKITLFTLPFWGGELYSAEKQPNIMFVMTDYQSFEDIPMLTPYLDMPALGRMCKEGIVFNNHYSNSPISQPARWTIVSGRYPHYHKKWDNGGPWLPEDSPILMKSIKDAGYNTIGIGKMHFTPWNRMAGFDTRIICDCQASLIEDDYEMFLRKNGHTRKDFLKLQNSTDIYGIYEWPMADSLQSDYYVGEQTCRYIRKSIKKDKPWFMWVSFPGPHNPWDAPKEFVEPYLKREIDTIPNFEKDLSEKPYDITVVKCNYTRSVADLFDRYPNRRNEIIHRIRAGHYAKLTFIDRQLQRIIEELKRKDLLDNTIIIFTADHGSNLGAHGLIHKGVAYERSAKVPFIVWAPGLIKKHKVVEGYTSHVDIFPTIMDLIGHSKNKDLEGRSFCSSILGEGNGFKESYIEVRDNTSIVTDKYKLILYRTFNEKEFFDLRKDPYELKNAYTNPKYKHLIDSLTNVLYKFDPNLRSDMLKGAERMKYNVHVTHQRIFKVEDGETLRRERAPYFGGKSFEVNFNIKSCLDNGMLFFTQDGWTHGLSLFVENRKLCVGVMEWGDKSVIKSKDSLPAGSVAVSMRLKSTGELSVYVNDILYINTLSKWPMPVQSGRHEFFAGVFKVGLAGECITSGKMKEDYKGGIENFILKF